MGGTGLYLTVVTLGFLLTLFVGQVLIRSGHGFLHDVFRSEETAASMTRLLSVLFHLVALGILGLVSTVDFPVEGAAQIIVTKLGGVLLVLGILHGGTMLLLARIKSRRRSQDVEDKMTSQYQSARRDQQDQHNDGTSSGERRPVIEAGPGSPR